MLLRPKILNSWILAYFRVLLMTCASRWAKFGIIIFFPFSGGITINRFQSRSAFAERVKGSMGPLIYKGILHKKVGAIYGDDSLSTNLNTAPKSFRRKHFKLLAAILCITGFLLKLISLFITHLIVTDSYWQIVNSDVILYGSYPIKEFVHTKNNKNGIGVPYCQSNQWMNLIVFNQPPWHRRSIS